MTSYEIARSMGFSKREAKAMVRWSEALVTRILSEQEFEKATSELRAVRKRKSR